MQNNTWYPLTHLGLLRISGNDAKKLLQGQLTCHLEELKPLQLQLAAHCNPQGRIISLFYLFMLNNSYYLQLPRETLPLAATALKKYAVFFKTAIEDASDQFLQFGFSGTPLSDNNNVLFAYPGENPRFLSLTEPKHANLSTAQKWRELEMSLQIPAIYPETSEHFLPHELNLPALNAVSFSKGCYTGQEIIARMHYRGKLKKHLHLATNSSPSPITRCQPIYLDDQVVGEIVDYCDLGYNHYLILMLVQESATLQALSFDPAGLHLLNAR